MTGAICYRSWCGGRGAVAQCSTQLASIEFNTSPSYQYLPSFTVEPGTLGRRRLHGPRRPRHRNDHHGAAARHQLHLPGVCRRRLRRLQRTGLGGLHGPRVGQRPRKELDNDRDDTSRLLTAGTLGPVAQVTTITTLDLDVSDITGTTATLTLTGHTGNWWYRNDVRYDPKGLIPYTQCYSAAGATQALSGLKPGTTYTFKTYPEYGCPPAKAIGTATFTTTS